jgi:hypothetical protein
MVGRVGPALLAPRGPLVAAYALEDQMAMGAPEVQTAPPRDSDLRQRKRNVRARDRGDYAELGQLDACERRDG